MKKIALITASVLALGAASIAADRTDATPRAGGADVIMASLGDISTQGIEPAEDTRLNAATIRASVLRAEEAAERSQAQAYHDRDGLTVRRVRNLSIHVDTCEDAYWPYYPAECLERVEAAGL